MTSVSGFVAVLVLGAASFLGVQTPDRTVLVDQAPQAAAAGAAVRRALPLIQQSGQAWLDRASCTSCHHQALAFVALQVAKDNGFSVDESAFASQVAESNERRFKYTQEMFELTGAINAVSGHGYQLLALAALRTPANDFTDASGFYLTGKQTSKGHWPSGSHRPPIEDSAFTLTATSIRALRVYPFGVQGEAAIARARAWLNKTPARSGEDRAMKLLGLVWSHASTKDVGRARKAILAEQQPDGGWSQVRGLASDAYATGQALVALRVSGGLLAGSQPFERGVRFLVSTQGADGSWHVPTRRVVEGLPYFETGFPHGIDQFISMAGTAWATMALAVYSTDGTVEALTHERPETRPAGPSPMAKELRDEPLFQAILHGTKDEVRSALEVGSDPNAMSMGGATPLILAARDPEMVAILLAAGAEPNRTSTLGSTALTLASTSYGGGPSMKLLLNAKADPDKGRPEEDEIPLAAAATSFEIGRLELLLKRGATFTDQAFSMAISVEDLRAVDFLIRKHNDVNAVNPEYGGNSVNDAVIQRNPDLVKLLLKHGGNPNVIDKEGFSALQVAALGDPEDSKIVALLLAAGADIDYETKERPKALVLATRRGNTASAALIRKASLRRNGTGAAGSRGR